MRPVWSTACPDWEERILARQSLIPFPPLFPAEAEAALDIFKHLRLVDVVGRPTFGEASGQWVFDFVGSIFGAYDAEVGRRLIRYFFLLISKKNSKSTLAAGVMLTALMRNWRESGEYYILAPTKEIADNSFLPARDMIAADEELRSLLHVQESVRLITHRITGAFLKVVSADTGTVGGKKTIGLLVDELWQFGPRANAAAMLREAAGGLTSRPEGFVIYLSTQSDAVPAGVFADELQDFRDIRDGKVIDPERLPVLYEFPPKMIRDGTYKDPRNFYVTNPNLGRSVDEPTLLTERAKAERTGQAALVNFFSKHLNVQPGMAHRSDGWAGALVWARGAEPGLTLDDILDRSEVVTVGIDGGGLDDLLGVAVIGREARTRRWLGWACGLISTIGLARRKANAEDYVRFKRAGDLFVFRFGGPDGMGSEQAETDPAFAELLVGVPPADAGTGAMPADIAFVVDLVAKVRDRGLLAQVGVDAAGIGAIVDALDGIGVTQEAEQLGAVRQGIGLMGAIKTVERKLADGSFRHGDNALLTWCVGNLKIVPTPTAMRVARDESGFGKVDPAMALFNAAALMAMNPEAEPRSVFETLAEEKIVALG